jgi:hypothetical protein
MARSRRVVAEAGTTAASSRKNLSLRGRRATIAWLGEGQRQEGVQAHDDQRELRLAVGVFQQLV